MTRFLIFTPEKKHCKLLLSCEEKCISDVEFREALDQIRKSVTLTSFTIDVGYDWTSYGNHNSYPSQNIVASQLDEIFRAIPTGVSKLCLANHPSLGSKPRCEEFARLPKNITSIKFVNFYLHDASHHQLKLIVSQCPEQVERVNINDGFNLFYPSLIFKKHINLDTGLSNEFAVLLTKEIKGGWVNTKAYRTLETISFGWQLNNIYNKFCKYRKSNPDAAGAAGNLYMKLLNAQIQFIQDGDADRFKIECDSSIKEARPLLAKHRGWKQILANLISAIASIITLGVVNMITKRGLFGFFPTQTDSTKQLNAMAKSLDIPIDNDAVAYRAKF